jgi:hypothetical protein
MANVSTTIQRLSVEFLPATTEVYLYIESSEPDNPFWGSGCKHKSYPAAKSLQDILPDFEEYLKWDYVCPTCKKMKGENTEYCKNTFHIYEGDNLLAMFEEPVEPAPI